MKKYTKTIEAADTGMVVAQIYRDGKRCALKFFDSIFDTQKGLKKKLRKANSWADERIKILERGEK